MKKAANKYDSVSQAKIQAIASQIAQKFDPQKILLFGSYARGDSHQHSDVDLLVVMDLKIAAADPEIEIALSIPHKFPMDIFCSVA
ncbi:MAG: nucleotidyltransferase family protein [bacterium]